MVGRGARPIGPGCWRPELLGVLDGQLLSGGGWGVEELEATRRLAGGDKRLLARLPSTAEPCGQCAHTRGHCKSIFFAGADSGLILPPYPGLCVFACVCVFVTAMLCLECGIAIATEGMPLHR